jgi:DNA-binding beta-propeller fold protein YncE
MKKSQLLAAPSVFSMARRCVLTVVLLVTGYSAALAASPNILAASPNIMISTDMMQPHLYLTNIDTDKRIRIDLSRDHRWPGGLPLHTIITPDGRKAYLSVMNTDDKPLTILALQIGNIDWNNGTADVKITKVIRAGDPGIKPSMLVPTETDPNQPVTALWTTSVNNHQLHGPTAHPSWKFVYFTDWTDNKIRVVDVATDELARGWIRSETVRSRANSMGSSSIRRATAL